ncbi:hypothetical protein FHW20_002178 [Ochrobactrum intermedium]|uniref:Uncharacterized protein n=1 Tax=Brucella intermedia TaxID=94625 RepID=A0ABR6AP62_9HYPH|nr:hypothetical protein [Brucella intermedia]MBA8851243.1 hypothetical protein [Brucella intermedia]
MISNNERELRAALNRSLSDQAMTAFLAMPDDEKAQFANRFNNFFSKVCRAQWRIERAAA